MSFLYMTITIALEALRGNKARSFLTMLGIVIGVSAVIALLSLGEGASLQIQRQIFNLGRNMLIILSGSPQKAGARMALGELPTLTVADAMAIQRDCQAVALTSYFIQKPLQVIIGNRNWNTIVVGVSPEMKNIRQWNLMAGRYIESRDLAGTACVAVLGRTVFENLFSLGQDPIGQFIRIKNVPFKVIGILERKGQTLIGQDQDNVVIIPFSTAERRLIGNQFLGSVQSIMVSAISAEAVEKAEQQTRALLRKRHRINGGRSDDFDIRSLSEIASTAEATAVIMTVLLGSVACISLFVGGIGIMNIMIVSVSERTREIGIRMAVGAREKEIMGQFLVEAMILSMIGGFIGMVLGILASCAISLVTKWPIIISAQSICIPFVFSAAVGIFFGFYPAYKASKLEPITALRHD